MKEIITEEQFKKEHCKECGEWIGEQELMLCNRCLDKKLNTGCLTGGFIGDNKE